MLHEEGFSLEFTRAQGSPQNGMAESSNRTCAKMMRCTLYSSDLGPEYWSYALRLAVYVKNKSPHNSIDIIPYQALTGKRADVSKLRIFGSRVCARIPEADKFPKLDHKNTNKPGYIENWGNSVLLLMEITLINYLFIFAN